MLQCYLFCLPNLTMFPQIPTHLIYYQTIMLKMSRFKHKFSTIISNLLNLQKDKDNEHLV